MPTFLEFERITLTRIKFLILILIFMFKLRMHFQANSDCGNYDNFGQSWENLHFVCAW